MMRLLVLFVSLLFSISASAQAMKSIQELNHRLVRRNDELLARVQELETELQGARRGNQQWAEDFEELDLAYGRLETDYDKLREELAHCKEWRDVFEEGKAISREAEE